MASSYYLQVRGITIPSKVDGAIATSSRRALARRDASRGLWSAFVRRGTHTERGAREASRSGSVSGSDGRVSYNAINYYSVHRHLRYVSSMPTRHFGAAKLRQQVGTLVISIEVQFVRTCLRSRCPRGLALLASSIVSTVHSVLQQGRTGHNGRHRGQQDSARQCRTGLTQAYYYYVRIQAQGTGHRAR